MNTWNLLFNYRIKGEGGKDMELIRVKIEGFRNIERNILNFSQLTSLVSINSYGKSNLLSAIEFAIDFINAYKDEKEEMMEWIKGIPLNKNVESKNFVADFEFITVKDNKEYNVNYGFEFMWIKQDNVAKIVEERLNIKLNEKGQRYITCIKRRNNKTTYRSSATGRCANVLKLEKNELAINKLGLYDNLPYSDIINKLNNLNVYIERHLDTTNSYQLNPLIKRGGDEFDLNTVNNIPRAIYFVREKYPDKYAILEDAYMQLFPNIERIEVEEIDISTSSDTNLDKGIPYLLSDKVYRMKVKDINLNQPINFEMLSDGARRVFLMLTYAVLADIKGLLLIAFEEPENSVHPNLLQSYLNVLLQLANNCKIIIASHSPYILQYVNTHDIYIGIPNNNGVANFKRIDSKKVKRLLSDASDISNSVGNYIFELLSGAEDDLEILDKYLEN